MDFYPVAYLRVFGDDVAVKEYDCHDDGGVGEAKGFLLIGVIAGNHGLTLNEVIRVVAAIVASRVAA